MNEKIKIIGACFDLGVNINGTEKAPLTLENRINKNNNYEWENLIYNKTTKELEKENLKKNLKEIINYNKLLYNKVSDVLNENKIPITIGGDHSIAIATSLASINKYKNEGLIWFDAHADFNTFDTTTTGNIHGIPLAAISNYEKRYLTIFHKGNFYNPKNIVIVGARDIDIPGELNNLKDANIKVFTTEDIKKYGMEEISKKAFEIASDGTNKVHISYDLDVIEPNEAPGVSVPVKNGITKEEAYIFTDYIIKNKNLIKSIDIVELNPEKDINNKTLDIAENIINKIVKQI